MRRHRSLLAVGITTPIVGSGILGSKNANATTSTSVSVRALVGGDDVYCALLTTGGAKCWGDNTVGDLGNVGQLGDGGSESFSNVPVTVSGLTNAVSLVNGGGSYCAVFASGGAKCQASQFDYPPFDPGEQPKSELATRLSLQCLSNSNLNRLGKPLTILFGGADSFVDWGNEPDVV